MYRNSRQKQAKDLFFFRKKQKNESDLEKKSSTPLASNLLLRKMYPTNRPQPQTSIQRTVSLSGPPQKTHLRLVMTDLTGWGMTVFTGRHLTGVQLVRWLGLNKSGALCRCLEIGMECGLAEGSGRGRNAETRGGGGYC